RHAGTSARTRGVPMVGLSFESLPREFFARPLPPRLLLPRARVLGQRESGADIVGLLRFNARMATMSAETFVHELLVERMHVREVAVGPEFRSGSQAGGDLVSRQRRGSRHGFVAGEIQPVRLGGERMSSTRIRAVL